MHYGCVVSSAEVASDLFEAVLSEVSGQVHADLAWLGYALASFFALQVGEADVKVPGYDLDDIGYADMPCGELDLSVEGGLGQFEGNFLSGGGRNRIDRREGSFEFSDIGLYLSGDELGYVVRHFHASYSRLLLDDCDAGLVAGGIDSGDEAPVESADQAIFEGRDLSRWAVAAEDDLFAVVVQCVECVEELLLAMLSLAEELDVVDDEHIYGAELALEAGQVAGLDGPDEAVDELFATEELDYGAVGFRVRIETDGVKEVGLSEA